MINEKYKKGIILGIIGVFLAGVQPIIANSRPISMDAYIFAAMTIVIETLIFFPLMLIERKRIKLNSFNNLINIEETESLLNGWKRGNNKVLIICAGITFAIAQILYFIGYQLAGSINGSLAQKTSIIFGLLFGFLINKEKITIKQVFFSSLLLFGLILAVTQGSFNILEFNTGVLVIIFIVVIWTIIHALTKPLFDRKEATPIFMVFVRNAIGSVFLITSYFIFFPIENVRLIFDPVNVLFFVLMGVAYGAGLYCWYNVLQLLGTSKSVALFSGSTLITAFFAILMLSEIFTIFHLIGMLLVIFSVVMIVKEGNILE